MSTPASQRYDAGLSVLKTYNQNDLHIRGE